MIRQAVLLCAGLGSRLRPFTDHAPKPMLPILGVPMVEWNIKRFIEFGVEEFFINLHYLPKVLQDYLGDGSKWGARIYYHFEPELLGTGGGVKSFEDLLNSEFFLIYGDIFSDIDYGAMEAEWRHLGGGVGMQLVRATENYADADVVELNESRRIIAVHPKPHTSVYQSAYRMSGVFILNRDILSGIPAGVYSEIGKDLLPSVVAQEKPFWGYICSDYSKGIDTLEKQREVEAYLSRHRIESPPPTPLPMRRTL
jgi:NDP-sugar pyrophosphorylase family protein